MDVNVTIDDLLEAIKTIIETVPDIGSVLTRERSVEDDAFIALFKEMNDDRSSNGVMILWEELISQDKGPRVCTILQKHRFSIEIMAPFDDKRPDGLTSHEVFVKRFEAINNALKHIEGNAMPWALGITIPNADVEHQFLQSNGPHIVRRWGSGSTSELTHYTTYTLDVLCVVNAHT